METIVLVPRDKGIPETFVLCLYARPHLFNLSQHPVSLVNKRAVETFALASNVYLHKLKGVFETLLPSFAFIDSIANCIFCEVYHSELCKVD